MSDDGHHDHRGCPADRNDGHGRPVRQERRPPLDSVDQVARGVGRIQLPISLPGLGHVNCYLIEDRRGLTLVDPGLPGPATWRDLKRKLSSVGLSVDAVHTVVVTHSHPDHFGQVPRFRRRGAAIITHRSFRTFLDPVAEDDDDDLEARPTGDSATVDHDHDPEPVAASLPTGTHGRGSTPWGGSSFQLPLRRRLVYGAMRLLGGRILSTPTPTRRVEDADILELGDSEWVAVHTPGHTRDHLCLWNADDGIMISGDHVLPTITPHISGATTDLDPLASFFSSLERMKNYGGVRLVLPAHGLPFDDLGGRADDIVRHHHERLDVLRTAGDRLGAAPVEDYMKVLFKSRSWGYMAESETYAHLKHLALLGEAKVTNGDQLRFSIGG